MKKLVLFAAATLICAGLSAQTKIAHVNFGELVQLMPETDQARSTLDSASKEAQEVGEGMVKEYQTKLQEYEQKKTTWSAAILQSKENELTGLQQRIMEYQQSIREELQQQEQQLMAPIYQKARDIVGELAKKGGFVYVFDQSSMLFIDEAQSVDLTKEARTALGIPADRTLESLQAELQAKQQQAL